MAIEAKWIRKALWDGVFLAGGAVGVYGVWQAWHPLGWIVGGAGLAAVGFLNGYVESGRKR